MFNYLFPIFCFGLAISGIVFLGLIEAARQARALDLVERERNSPRATSPSRPIRNQPVPRLTAQSVHDSL